MVNVHTHWLMFSFLISILSCAAVHAAQHDSANLRTALVLGGGGARGAAHIGVLEILERERIPVACIVGTSMGALVAGAYASGLSPAQMRKKLSDSNWTDMFLDGADYSQVNYRQTQVTRRYLSGTQMDITKNGLELQTGVIAGEKIKLFFNHLVGADLGEREIQHLTIPIAIIATDIGTGEKVIFRDGSLTQAMRASMSVPGLMAPVEYRGHKLVDGGLVDNLPIAVARQLCDADRVIVVNVGSPLRPAKEINSLLSVTGQMIDILTQQNIQRSLATLTPEDIYIHPKLNNVSVTDFVRHKEITDLGRDAAEEKLEQLKALSVSENDYAAWAHKNKDSREPYITIDHIKISPLKIVNLQFVERQIHQKPHTLFNREQLEKDLIRTYADGYYTGVDYQITEHNNEVTLEILVSEKTRSKDHVTFGYSASSEYRQGSSLSLLTAYRNTWMNSYGGEFFATADFGTKSALQLDFYQPLNLQHDYFIESIYSKSRESIGLFFDDKKFVEYDLITAYSELSVGKNIDTYGQASVGWREYHKKSEETISSVNYSPIDETYGGVLMNVTIDKRNRLYFPSHGWYTNLQHFAAQDQQYKKLTANVTFAYSIEDYILASRSAYTTSLDGVLPIYDSAALGGFLNLSGYATNQILGDNVFYMHMRTEKIIGSMPLGLNGDMRIGLGIEGAHVGSNYTMPNNKAWLNSAVIYLGGETPLGPIYIGYGFTLGGDYNLYFRMGAF